MTNLPPAAVQFLSEVRDSTKAEGEPYGDPDGYGTVRSVRFEADDAEQLKGVLESLDGDERIESFRRDGHGLTVTFVPTYLADFDRPFGVGEAVAVLNASDEQPAEAEKPAAKKTAKKTVSPDN